MDGLSARRITRPPVNAVPLAFVVPPVRNEFRQRRFSFYENFYTKSQAVVAAAAVIMAFGLGIWTSVATPKSSADDHVFEVSNSKIGNEQSLEEINPVPLASVDSAQSPVSVEISNDVLFNTPIGLLRQYFESPVIANKLAERKAKIKEFLEKRGSPMADQADTIAEQDHWKFILAIAFAESTLGKRCPDNNCSGIGVAPGHPLWRKYPNREAWIIDFNKLLEKRYKDKTLEQMCGVYVQPCNPNWLLATRQILKGLDEAGIK